MKHAVAMVNGTAALEVALRVVGVDPGSEVLMPSLTFMQQLMRSATSMRFLILWTSKMNPSGLILMLLRHLKKSVDRQRRIFNKETGRRISAIVPVCLWPSCSHG